MKNRLTALLLILATSLTGWTVTGTDQSAPAATRGVYVIPIREDIMPPLVYVVRRGVKEAMESGAELLVVDMETNGGRVDVTEEITEILGNFPGDTVTFVNRKAISAGALISLATQRIFMAPQSVIGDAAPILMAPGGAGAQDVPSTLEAKMTSMVRALARTSAQRNGYNIDVVEAMIEKNRQLILDEVVLNHEGELLTLTNIEAEQKYGDPPTPLLSSGTFESLDDLLAHLGYQDAKRVDVQPTGAEQLATWINAISPLLLIIGIVGIYIELKTPGFGLPGIVGLLAFGIYFLGGYIAGLSGMEWILVFLLGVVMVTLELFLFPGTIVLGLTGAALMLVSLVMAMVDVYPGMPTFPAFEKIEVPIRDLVIAVAGAGVAVFFLSRWLPHTPFYGQLVTQSASGVQSVAILEQEQAARIGQTGITLSPLRPGGKARFGDAILDVISQGEMIDRNETVKIVGHSGSVSVVERG